MTDPDATTPDIEQLIDMQSFAGLLQCFHAATGVACSLVAADGRPLIQIGRSRVCREFHHTGKAAAGCIFVNPERQRQLPGGRLTTFRCGNGLAESVRPIEINGIRIATLFFGQVLYDEPDVDFFCKQANRNGHDAFRYIECLRDVPIVEKERFESLTVFVEKTAQMIASVAIAGIKRYELEAELTAETERRIEMNDILDHSPAGFLWTDAAGRIEYINRHFTRLVGYSPEELPDLETFIQLLQPESSQTLIEKAKHAEVSINVKTSLLHRDGYRRYFTVGAAHVGQRTLFSFNDITELVQTENSLALREQEYRSLAESSRDFISRHDVAGTIRYTNVALRDRFRKFGIENVEGERIHALSSTRGFAGLSHTIQEVMQTGEVRMFETDATDADGKTEYYQFSVAPERDTAGMIIGAISSGRDITTLRLTERRLQSFIESLPGLAFTFRLAGKNARFTYVSPRVREFCGLHPDRTLGTYRVLFRIIGREFRRPLFKAVLASRADRGAFNFEAELQPEGAPRRWVDIRALPEFDTDGSILWHGILIDISERKRSETRLEETRNTLRNVLQTIPDLVWLKDINGLYQFCNHAFEGFFGAEEAQIIGKTDHDFVDSDLADFFREKDLQAVRSGGICVNDEWVTFSGESMKRLLETRKVPLYDQESKVVGVLGVARDITEKNAYREKIHRMAYYDPLTSLPNRAMFHDQLLLTLAETETHQRQTAIMLLDIDRFKTINDSLGHLAGDTLLCEVASRIKHCLRTSDTVARLGGDEFALLLPDIRTDEDLGRIACKILRSFDAPFSLEEREVFVTGSIGVAVFPDDARNATDLLKHADTAMYHAKRSGRNNYQFFTENLSVAARDRLHFEAELRKAIAREDLQLFFQPKVLLSNLRPVGSEALLRWYHPERGMLSPQLTVQIAEETGLIHDIGEWAIENACSAARRLNEGGREHRVSVNLSAKQFQVGSIAAIVNAALQRNLCNPAWLEVEITEGLLLSETDRTLKELHALKDLGVCIAIDDFGTGYSSLSYLSRFPIDTLKIDRSFVNRIGESEKDGELVRAIIAIGHSLRLTLVAEGVETEEQAEFLREAGCHQAKVIFLADPYLSRSQTSGIRPYNESGKKRRAQRPHMKWLMQD